MQYKLDAQSLRLFGLVRIVSKKRVASECTAIMIGRSSCPCQCFANKRGPILDHGPRSLTCVCLCAEQAPDMCICNQQRFRFLFFVFFGKCQFPNL